MLNKVYIRTTEQRKNISRGMGKLWQDPEYRKKHCKPCLEETKRKISKTLFGHVSYWKSKKFSEEHKKNLSKPRFEEVKANMRGHCGVYIWTKEHKKQQSKHMTIVMNRPEIKEKISKTSKKNWQDPEFQKMMAKTKALKPNKLEQFFDSLTPECVRYVGDFSLWIKTKNGARNPDFIIEGQNKVIEIFGDYYHKGENQNDKIEEYAGVGFNCIIFWESEIYDETKRVLKETLELIKS